MSKITIFSTESSLINSAQIKKSRDKMATFEFPERISKNPKFDEYKRFLLLKVGTADFFAVLLSPSLAVDALWHSHILDTVNYMEMCNEIGSGNFIHHNPNSCQKSRPQRMERTAKLHKCVFGKESPPDWGKDGEATVGRKREREDEINIAIKTLTGKKIHVKLDKMSTIGEVKAEIQRIEGIPVDQTRLIFAGKELDDDEKTLEDCFIKDDCVLHSVLKLRGC